MRSHDASADVRILEMVLARMIEKEQITSLHDLWVLSEKARVPTVMPFGKHKGMPISEVPADYVGWLMRQPDIDPYLVKAFKSVG